jgi:hypothetical protein
LECEKSVKVRVNSVATIGLEKYRRDLMGVQKVTLDKGGLEPAQDFSVFYGEKYKNY